MAWSAENQRWECDRCGKKIPSNHKFALCNKCREKLHEEEQREMYEAEVWAMLEYEGRI